MLRFSLKRTTEPLRLLCIGAHSDDIEIGCGGTIIRMLDEERCVSVHWVVLGANEERAVEARQSTDVLLKSTFAKEIITKDFCDGFFPYFGAEIKYFFEELKARVTPHIVFTHYRSDLHQDHRVVSELTWNTFRNHLILEYEIPKYDGDLGTPNFFVPLTRAISERKVAHIVNCFSSQRGRNWFGEETFFSLLRLRGLECNAPEKYAEAYYCRKLVY